MYLIDLKADRLSNMVGNKAQNLRRLHDWGFRIPDSLVCSARAYQRYTEGDATVLRDLQEEIQARQLFPGRYAVRSSADVEDSFEHSFAGQFKSFLGVDSVDKMIGAIRAIWDATDTAATRSYLARLHQDEWHAQMAVLIQKMVSPRVSGVCFSRNPMTGANEVIIEAVSGSGEALTQEGCTPLRWVSRRGQWIHRPEENLLDESLTRELINQTRRIARIHKADVDLEWVYDGDTIYWVQLRNITSLRDLHIYSNRIAKEMLPGLIKPLTWSISVPLVNACWARLLAELTGEELDPNALARSFYYRTYFEVTAMGRVFERLGMPRDALEVMMGLTPGDGGMPRFRPGMQMLRLLPRVARFVASKWSFAQELDAALPRLVHRQKKFTREAAANLDEQELLARIDQLYELNQKIAYYTVIAQLLMFAYNGMLRRQLRNAGFDSEQFDATIGLDELRDYDPGYHLGELHRQFASLPREVQQRVRSSSYQDIAQMPELTAFQESVRAFLARFGHVSDSGNDFAVTPWRERPDQILRLIVDYPVPAGHGSRLTRHDVHLKGLRRRMFDLIYRRARDSRLYRERTTYAYAYGCGIFRTYFLLLADHLVRRGILAEASDIFYLYANELRDIVGRRNDGRDAAAWVAQRKAEIEKYRDISVPSIIYGDEAPPPVSPSATRLTGVATSRGYYTGKVTVVRGIEDFDRVEPGDVLVVPYSDVGWTPLFAKAGAVIAESGGMLSHSSIVAREYGIPAVVSVPDATRLQNGCIVTVDGFAGEIILHEVENA